MYDRHLDAFIQVADCGSFLKASQRLFISANAVTKQVNLLEERLGVKLFARTARGVALTEAGKLVYDEGKKLIRHSDAVTRRARELGGPRQYVIRVGVSLMNPANFLLEQWGKAAAQYPNLRLEMAPFEDTVQAFQEVLDHLGEKIDVISCPYDTDAWGDRYRSLHLRDLPLCVACAKSHPLAARGRLAVRDLYGQTVWISARGTGHRSMDRARDELERHPEIRLKDCSYLNLGGFNQLAASGDLAISAPCWSGVHPLLATIPVEWGQTLPFGLIFAKDPPDEVAQFVLAVGRLAADG